ncbi:MAG: UDP-2,3-diacylglucosamine diphosphatase [bacterium]
MAFGVDALVELKTPAYFLSDVHLGEGSETEERAKQLKFFAFLREVESQAKTLVFVGDVFDFWYEWQTVIPKEHFGLLCRLRRLCDARIALHYLPGNHDFRLSGFLETELQMVVHPDAAEFQVGEQRIYVGHGDGLLARDAGFRLFRRLLRNRLTQRLFSWLHPDLGMALARTVSRRSRSKHRYRESDEAEYEAFAKAHLARGFRGVIIGHSHHPRQVDFPNGTYVNLGDWIRHFSYGIHDGNRLALHHWQGS